MFVVVSFLLLLLLFLLLAVVVVFGLKVKEREKKLKKLLFVNVVLSSTGFHWFHNPSEYRLENWFKLFSAPASFS